MDKTENYIKGSKERTAYHEAGHALVNILRPGYKPVSHVEIDGNNGTTYFLEKTEPQHLDQREILARTMIMLAAGAAAEETIYGNIAIGNVLSPDDGDDVKIRNLADTYVEEYGILKSVKELNAIFSEKQATEKKGVFSFLKGITGLFCDRGKAPTPPPKNEIFFSDKGIIKHFIGITATSKAKEIIQENLTALHNIAEALIEHEHLEAYEIREIIEQSQNQPAPETENIHA